MKKLYTSALALLVCTSALLAQTTERNARMRHADVQRVGHQTPATGAERAVIWTNDFSAPTDWVISNDPTGFDVNWEVGIGLVSGGQYGTPAIQSTTAANGYAMLCSDCGNNAGSTYEKSYLTTANPIDLSVNPYVIMEFQTMYRRFNNEQTYIAISTDGVTWPQPPSDTATVGLPNGLYPVWADGELTQSVAVPNPTKKQINISSAAGGQSQVWVRFYWYGVWGYAWYVDDVKIFDQYQYDLSLNSAYISHTGDGNEFGRVPVSQLSADLNVGGSVTNFGVNAQTNVVLHVETKDATNTTVLTYATAPASMATAENVFIDQPVAISGWTPGLYTTTVWLTSDQSAQEGDTENDTIVRVFEVTPDVSMHTYSLDGIGVYPTSYLTSLGTNSFTANPDGIFCMTNYFVEQDMPVYGLRVGLANGTDADGLIIASIHDSSNVFADDMSAPYVESGDYYVTATDVANGYAYIRFNNSYTLTPGVGYFAAVELYSNDTSTNIRILDDVTVAQPGSVMYLPTAIPPSTTPPGWISNGNAFAIALVTEPTIGVSEMENLVGVQVYPNPTIGLVTISASTTDRYTVEVMNVLGEVVHTDNFNMNLNMDLSGLAKGAYTVRVSTSEATSVQLITLN